MCKHDIRRFSVLPPYMSFSFALVDLSQLVFRKVRSVFIEGGLEYLLCLCEIVKVVYVGGCESQHFDLGEFSIFWVSWNEFS